MVKGYRFSETLALGTVDLRTTCAAAAAILFFDVSHVGGVDRRCDLNLEIDSIHQLRVEWWGVLPYAYRRQTKLKVGDILFQEVKLEYSAQPKIQYVKKRRIKVSMWMALQMSEIQVTYSSKDGPKGH